MRRDPSELPFSGRAPRRAQVPDTDRQVSYVNGRAFLRETTRHDPDYAVNPADLRAIGERNAEAAADRQARETANLNAALRLGAALKVLKGDG